MSIADKLQTIANNVEAVYGTGLNKGYVTGEAYGRDIGYTEGYAVGKSDGKDDERSEFWDNYQSNGNRTSYEMAFKGEYWAENFKPKYDLNVIDGAQMFYAFGGFTYTTAGVTYDLTTILENYGVTLDTSNCTNLSNFYSYGSFSRVPITDTTGTTKTLSGLANYCRKLKKFDKLILKDDGSNLLGTMFNTCVSLTDIVIEGVIGDDFDIKHSPLNKESIISIVEHLSTTASGKTVSFKKSAVNKAFETSSDANNGSTSTEWTTLIQPYSNWTISLI